MQDLLEVARQHPWWYSDQNLANLMMVEIERLQSELDSCAECVKNSDAKIKEKQASIVSLAHDLGKSHRIIQEQQGEIERYQNLFRIQTVQTSEHIKALNERFEDRREVYMKEIERLREENEALEWFDGKGTEAAEIERLREENDYLGELLRECLDQYIPFKDLDLRSRVKKAIGDEE